MSMNPPVSDLLLLSNSTQPRRNYLDHAETEIREVLGNRKKVLFIPFAMHDCERYAEQNRARFAAMGYGLDSLHRSEDPVAAVEEAEAIFVGGGNTFRLLKALYDHDLLTALRERVQAGIPYLGSSAGTVVACPTLRTTNDMPIVQPPSFAALGMIRFQINPHYCDADPFSSHMGETRRQRLIEFVEETGQPVVALREGAMLCFEKGRAKLSGSASALIFSNAGEPAEMSPGSFLDI
jgi:dipeptidase E